MKIEPLKSGDLSDKTAETVREILVEQLGVAEERIVPEAAIEADLGADSLDRVELVMKLEETFSLSIPDNQAEKVVTVRDLCQVLAIHLGQTGKPA